MLKISFVFFILIMIIWPRQANLLPIAYTSSEVQASLRIRAVSPEPPLLAHTSSQSRGTFNQKARSLVHLNGWACAIKICQDGMLEDTNSLDSALLLLAKNLTLVTNNWWKTVMAIVINFFLNFINYKSIDETSCMKL